MGGVTVFESKIEKITAMCLAGIAVLVTCFMLYSFYTDSRVKRDSRDVESDLQQAEAAGRRAGDRLDDASGEVDQARDVIRGAERGAAEISQQGRDLAKSADGSRREIGECLGILDRCESRNRELAEILDGLEKESAGSGTQAQSRTPTA